MERLNRGDPELENTGYYLSDDWKEGEPYKINKQKPRL